MTETNTNEKVQELDKITELQLEIEKLSNESKSNWDLYIRCKAEIENIKKRTDKEISNTSHFALQNILTDFLPLIDSFELCLNNKDSNNNIHIDGITLIYKMLINILEKYNLKKIMIENNEKLDISKHEVISVIYDESCEEDDKIKSIFQNGYMLNDRILRYAKVSIIKKNK